MYEYVGSLFRATLLSITCAWAKLNKNLTVRIKFLVTGFLYKPTWICRGVEAANSVSVGFRH